MKRFLLILVLAALFIGSVHAVSDEQKAQDVLKKAADNLGWPDTVTQDVDSDGNPQPQYFISYDGKGGDSDLRASIYMVPTEALSGFWLDFASEQVDFTRSSYQGRDGAISRYGKNCNPKPLVKAINEFAVGWMESIFGESKDPDKGCVTDHGAIIWACGKYLMLATDDRSDEGGEEDNIAAALYSSATEAGLCDYGDTVVIMADTPDVPGSKSMMDIIPLGQKVNEYYGVNTYNQQPPFRFTFRDQDGTKGTDDWYHLIAPMSGYAGSASKFDDYGAAAIKESFKGADLPQDLYLERVVVVFPGEDTQNDPSAPLYSACAWHKDDYSVEVDAMQGKRKVFTKNIIFLSENRILGTWAHEFGHSMTSKFQYHDFYHVTDRYSIAGWADGNFGEINMWGLMGYGTWWGTNGDKPVQMMSYSKYSASYIGFTSAALNQTYTITSLEDMKKGDNALTLDDPASADPNDYYIIEARDSTAPFGAPESGVVLYKVSKDPQHGFTVVNVVPAQAGVVRANGAFGQSYTRATLYGTSGNGSVYTNVPGKFKIRLLTKTDKSDEISIEGYTPAALVGAVVNPQNNPVSPPANQTHGAPPKDPFAPEPDLDLHAYDQSNNHVGMNYGTGQYENNIPGAVASGDLQGDEEWIFVPQGTQARFEVSSYKTQQFLVLHPGFASVPENYTAKAVKYDSQGNRFEADLGKGSADAGAKIDLRSPEDPGLKYEAKNIPGVGTNSVCPLLPGFLMLLAIGAFLKNRMD